MIPREAAVVLVRVGRFVCVLLVILCGLLVFSVASAQQPLPKVGSCPSGFYPSDKYCVPLKDKSKPAMLRGGQCPTGYYTSGKYCVAMSEKSKPAIPKDGLCPTGYYASGGYCVQATERRR